MPTVETTHLCNIEAEKRLLGYLLFENCLDELLSKVPLSSKCFTFRAFRVIWEALFHLHSCGKETNLMSLMMRISECGLKNIVTEEIIQELLDVSNLGLNILKPEQAIAHAEEIYKYSQQREFINLLTDCAERLSSARGSYEEERNEVANKLNDFLGNFSLDKRQTLHYLDETIGKVVLEIIECMGEEDRPIEGVKSNLLDLDALIASFKPRQSIIVAARPSMGKTSLATYFAFQALKARKGAVVFFSAEMGWKEITHRFLSLHSKINLTKLTNGACFTPDEFISIEESTNYLSSIKSDRRLFVEDSSPSQLSFSKVRSTLVRAQREHQEINLVVVDYLQLIAGAQDKSDNRNLIVGKWSRFLKEISKEYDCPVIALSQLSRGVESRSNKRPMLSDLRDSGEIEQDADIVILLHREDYYSDQSNPNSDLELIVAKNRNGATGTAKVLFKRPTQEFLNSGNHFADNYQEM